MRKGKRYSLLMIGVNQKEIQRHAPVNFYDWSFRAKQHYVAKRWPNAIFICNGDPVIPRSFFPRRLKTKTVF